MFRLDDLAREIDDEILFHLDMKAAELEAAGMDPDEARAEARRRFGHASRIREECRSVARGVSRRSAGRHLVSSTARDLVQGVRSLSRTPALSLTAILTIAIGIGASTAAWSITDRVLFRLPVADPDRVVQLMEVWENGYPGYNSPRNIQDWVDHATVFERVAPFYADDRAPVLLERGDRREVVSAIFASSELLPVLGVQPLLGRGFRPEEDALGAAPVVIISHAFWMEELGGAPDVLGRPLSIATANDPRLPEDLRPPGFEPGFPTRSFTIVGVLPPGFELPPLELGNGARHGQLGRSRTLGSGLFVDRPDVLVPWGLFTVGRQERGFQQVRALALLSERATLERARQEINRLATEVGGGRFLVRLTTMRALQRETYGDRLTMLAVGAVFLLLTACSNVAALLLARGERRERECAVRACLGAGRLRLVRQLLTETGVIAVAGAVAGIALAWGATVLLASRSPTPTGFSTFRLVDLRVLAGASTLTLAALVLAGLLPAVHGARPDLHRFLSAGASTPSKSRRTLLRWITVSQLAISVTLLVGTGLLMRSLDRVSRVDPGVGGGHFLIVGLELLPGAASAYPRNDSRRAHLSQIVARVRALPGVVAVELMDHPLGGQPGYVVQYSTPGTAGDQGVLIPAVEEQRVTPGFFALLGIPVIAGTAFTEEHQALPASGVFPMIVNESLARRYFPGGDAVGRSMRWGGHDSDQPLQPIVGVVGDVRLPELGAAVPNQVYDVSAGGFFWGSPPRTHLVVETRTDARLEARRITEVIASIDQAEPRITSVETMTGIIEASLAPRRYQALLASLAAGAALALGLVGLFGLMSHSVSRRTRENGLRRALGAGRAEVVGSVMREAVLVSAGGLALGIAAAAGLGGLIEAELFGVTALDPPTYAVVAVAMILVAPLAAWWPARRAALTDPVAALRAE